MASFLAIAGVSRTLRSLLRDRMEQPPVNVTIAPPDAAVSGMTGRRLNLYLYQVVENGHLKNQEIPGQGHPADYGRPPLSLDLHYLITAYGADDTNVDADLEAQQILGDAMRVLHEHPIVTEALHENDNPADPLILDASLLGEFEKVKVTLQPSGLEELSKLWTALPETNFRRSVTYQVSVVQIESRRPRRSGLPVRERRVYAFPLQTPRIAEIVRDPPFDGVPSAVAEVGDTILILGDNLAGQATRVRLGEVDVPAAAPPQARRISLAVPSTVAAGLHAVQVIHDLPLRGEPGQPLVPHRGFASNAVPLLVVPRLVGIAPSPAGPGAVVTVTVDPPAGAAQEKLLLLGDFSVPAEPAPVNDPPSPTVAFRLPAGAGRIPAGTHLARVRVDGAESRLTTDPVTTRYDGPEFTVAP
jgi:hypothetical protein